MPRLEKLKVNKVWADEIFYGSETVEGIQVLAPAGILFTADSTIIGTATVAVMSCELSVYEGTVTATVEYMVQEELTVQIEIDPGPDDFDLEYSFRYEEEYIFQKLTLPGEVAITNLHCQVFRFEGNVELADVDLPVGESEGSFDNIVNTMTKLKVVEEIQTFVSLGEAPYVTTATVTATPIS